MKNFSKYIQISINKEVFNFVKAHLKNTKGKRISDWLNEEISKNRKPKKLQNKHVINSSTALSLTEENKDKLELILKNNNISLKDYFDYLLTNYIQKEGLSLPEEVPTKINEKNSSKINFRINEELYKKAITLNSKTSKAELFRELLKDFLTKYGKKDMSHIRKKVVSYYSTTIAISPEMLKNIQEIGYKNNISIQDICNFMLEEFIKNNCLVNQIN